MLNLKGRLGQIVIKAYVRALEYTHGKHTICYDSQSANQVVGVSLCYVTLALLAALFMRQRNL